MPAFQRFNRTARSVRPVSWATVRSGFNRHGSGRASKGPGLCLSRRSPAAHALAALPRPHLPVLPADAARPDPELPRPFIELLDAQRLPPLLDHSPADVPMMRNGFNRFALHRAHEVPAQNWCADGVIVRQGGVKVFPRSRKLPLPPVLYSSIAVAGIRIGE